MNLARVADTSGSGAAGDATGEASDGRVLVSPETRSSSWSSRNWTVGLEGASKPDLGDEVIAVRGRIVELGYGGGAGSSFSVLPALTELRPKIAPIRLRGTVARRTTRALQVRAVFDFFGAVFFIHLYPVAVSIFSAESSRISASHFLPLCLLKTIRSEANQADTAASPKEAKAEKTVVRVEVT
jgi:hypothetical protein